MSETPTTVGELFPSKWLRADALPQQGTRVRIEAADIETVRSFDGGERQALILSFTAGGRPCGKRMIANATQARTIAAIVGSDAFERWPGHEVTLTPGLASNGKPTIVVEPACDA